MVQLPFITILLKSVSKGIFSRNGKPRGLIPFWQNREYQLIFRTIPAF